MARIRANNTSGGGTLNPSFVVTQVAGTFNQTIDLTKSYLYTAILTSRQFAIVGTVVAYIDKGTVDVVNSSSYVTVSISGTTLQGRSTYADYTINSVTQLD